MAGLRIEDANRPVCESCGKPMGRHGVVDGIARYSCKRCGARLHMRDGRIISSGKAGLRIEDANRPTCESCGKPMTRRGVVDGIARYSCKRCGARIRMRDGRIISSSGPDKAQQLRVVQRAAHRSQAGCSECKYLSECSQLLFTDSPLKCEALIKIDELEVLL